MSIDRTAYNALVNDDGSNTTGTLFIKTLIEDVILGPVDAAIAAAVAGLGLPAGTVLQVVNATTTTGASSSSSTLADTNLTASITPSSASNKVLVIVNQSGVYKVNATSVKIALLRGATVLKNFAEIAGYTNSAAENVTSVGGSYLDSPSSTSSVTYKTQFASVANIASVQVQNSSAVSSITLMEIKG